MQNCAAHSSRSPKSVKFSDTPGGRQRFGKRGDRQQIGHCNYMTENMYLPVLRVRLRGVVPIMRALADAKPATNCQRGVSYACEKEMLGLGWIRFDSDRVAPFRGDAALTR